MQAITAEEILSNSPLNTGGREEVPKYERKLAKKVNSLLDAKPRFIISVDGLRRVGKTILLKQALNRALGKRQAFYFSFDKRSQQTPQALEQVISFFIKKDNGALICLDEVGKISDWAGIIKKHYDRSRAAFLISSSATLQMKKGGESLAGRMARFTLPPMEFDEYLELSGIKKGELKLSLEKPAHSAEFEEYLPGFLSRGAYPELCSVDDSETVRQYVRKSTVEKMIFEDIPGAFSIAHPAKLLEIYNYFASYSSEFVHEQSISGLTGLSALTVADYVSYLEESHLVRRVYTEANFSKMIRKKKKGFVASPTLYSQTASEFSTGRLVETAVFSKLSGLQPMTYRDSQKREVDFIVAFGGKKYAIEVKSGAQVARQDLASLVHYLRANKSAYGCVIYRGPYDSFEIDGITLQLIPLSTFLAAGSILP